MSSNLKIHKLFPSHSEVLDSLSHKEFSQLAKAIYACARIGFGRKPMTVTRQEAAPLKCNSGAARTPYDHHEDKRLEANALDGTGSVGETSNPDSPGRGNGSCEVGRPKSRRAL